MPARPRRNRLLVVVYHGTARLQWTLTPSAKEGTDHVALGNYLVELGQEIRAFPPPLLSPDRPRKD